MSLDDFYSKVLAVLNKVRPYVGELPTLPYAPKQLQAVFIDLYNQIPPNLQSPPHQYSTSTPEPSNMVRSRLKALIDELQFRIDNS